MVTALDEGAACIGLLSRPTTHDIRRSAAAEADDVENYVRGEGTRFIAMQSQLCHGHSDATGYADTTLDTHQYTGRHVGGYTGQLLWLKLSHLARSCSGNQKQTNKEAMGGGKA